MLDSPGAAVDGRSNVVADANCLTSVPAVFAAGDTRCGQSLVVWAIAEGSEAAHGVDEFLMGASKLPV
jgi:glutamate synthase (NADPH/NADH) small chain